MASLNPMYDMLERNMDQPLTALSKIPIFKRRKVVLIAFLYSNSPYFYSPYCKLHLRTFCTELGSKKVVQLSLSRYTPTRAFVKIKYQPVIYIVLLKLDFGQNMGQNKAMADDLLADAKYLLPNSRLILEILH